MLVSHSEHPGSNPTQCTIYAILFHAELGTLLVGAFLRKVASLCTFTEQLAIDYVCHGHRIFRPT